MQLLCDAANTGEQGESSDLDCSARLQVTGDSTLNEDEKEVAIRAGEKASAEAAKAATAVWNEFAREPKSEEHYPLTSVARRISLGLRERPSINTRYPRRKRKSSSGAYNVVGTKKENQRKTDRSNPEKAEGKAEKPDKGKFRELTGGRVMCEQNKCSKVFMNIFNFNRHHREQHMGSGRKHKCKDCDVEFCRGTQLKRHFESVKHQRNKARGARKGKDVHFSPTVQQA